MKTKPFEVVTFTDAGETVHQIRGPVIDPARWRYIGKEAAQNMCRLFNSIYAAGCGAKYVKEKDMESHA